MVVLSPNIISVTMRVSGTIGGISKTMLLLSLSHVMVGRGTPTATQVKLALSGETIVMLTGPVLILGGTTKKKHI